MCSPDGFCKHYPSEAIIIYSSQPFRSYSASSFEPINACEDKDIAGTMRMLKYSSSSIDPFHQGYHRRNSPRQIKKKVARDQLASTFSPPPSFSSHAKNRYDQTKLMSSCARQKIGGNHDPLLLKEIPALPGTVFTKVEDPSCLLSVSSSDSYSEITYPVASTGSIELEDTIVHHATNNKLSASYPLDVDSYQPQLKPFHQDVSKERRPPGSGRIGKSSDITLKDTLAWRHQTSSQYVGPENTPLTKTKGFVKGDSVAMTPPSDSSTEATVSKQSTRNAELSAINAARKVRQRLKDAKMNASAKTNRANGLPDFMALKARLKKTKETPKTSSPSDKCNGHHRNPAMSCNSTVTSATATSESNCSNSINEKDEQSTRCDHLGSINNPTRFIKQGRTQNEDACKIISRKEHEACLQYEEKNRLADHRHHFEARDTDVSVVDSSATKKLDTALSEQTARDSTHLVTSQIVHNAHISQSQNSVSGGDFDSHACDDKNGNFRESRPKDTKSDIHSTLNAMFMQRAAGQKTKANVRSEQTARDSTHLVTSQIVHNAHISQSQNSISSGKIDSHVCDDKNEDFRESRPKDTKSDIHSTLNAMFMQRAVGQKKTTNVRSQRQIVSSGANEERERVENKLSALFSLRAQLPTNLPSHQEEAKVESNKPDSAQLRPKGSSQRFEPVESRDDQESMLQGESERDEYEKYKKMLKMGIPDGAVQNAMKRDGVDPSPMFGAHSGGTRSIVAGKNKCKKDPYRRTRLHWDPVENFSKESIWHQLTLDKDLEHIKIDIDEFNDLFQTKVSVISAPVRSRENAQEGAVKVIDRNRANNGGIILARLRMSHEDLSSGIDSINESFLTAQQITGIMEFIPTSKERKALTSFMNSGQDISMLCECEKFMVSIMKVKEAKKKMKAMLCKLDFTAMVANLVESIETLSLACEEILTSKCLLKLLGVVLKVGNRLNRAGVETIKTDAGGFAIESLRKLNQVKAWDKKTTLMMYITDIIRRWNESLLDVKHELPHVLKTQNVTDYIPTLSELEKQIHDVRRTALLLEVEDHKGCEEEETLLRKSEIGLFVLDSTSTLEHVRRQSGELERKFDEVLQYLAQNGDIKPLALFDIIASFCLDLDSTRSQNNEKKHFHRSDR